MGIIAVYEPVEVSVALVVDIGVVVGAGDDVVCFVVVAAVVVVVAAVVVGELVLLAIRF